MIMTDMAEEEGSGGEWTDEKHISYLNWMEASFVSWMLFGGGSAYPPGARGLVAAPAPLPLDRDLPDGADSTLDCRPDKGGRRRASPRPREGRRGFAEGLRRTRRRLQRRCTAPRVQDDQVVPVFEMVMKGGENVRPLSTPDVVRRAATDDQLPAE